MWNHLAAYDGTTIVLVIAVSLAAAATQRVTGFAFGLVMIGLLPPVLGGTTTQTSAIRLANLLSSVSALVPLVLVAVQFWRYVDRPTLVRTVISAACGLPFGLVLFEWASPVWLGRLSGLVILLLTIDIILRKPPVAATPAEPKWGLIAGFAAGFLHGCVGLPGPPIVLFAARQSWSPNEVRGFVACSMIWIAVSKLVLFAVRGHLTTEVWTWAAATLPAALAGCWIGALVARKLNTIVFQYLVLGTVAISGVQLLLTPGERAPEERAPASGRKVVAVGSGLPKTRVMLDPRRNSP